MAKNRSANRAGWIVASLTFCALLTLQLLATAAYMLWLVPHLRETFGQLDVQLPRLTAWVLELHFPAAIATVVVLGLVLLKEMLVALIPRTTFTLNLLLFLLGLAWLPLLIFATYLPLLRIIESLT